MAHGVELSKFILESRQGNEAKHEHERSLHELPCLPPLSGAVVEEAEHDDVPRKVFELLGCFEHQVQQHCHGLLLQHAQLCARESRNDRGRHRTDGLVIFHGRTGGEPVIPRNVCGQEAR